MSLFNAYVDVPDVLANGAAGIETASLIGGLSTLASPVTAGAGTATIVAPAAGQTFPANPAIFDLWILDGPNSEHLQAQVAASPANTLTLLTAPLANHAAGVTVSSPGISGGSLASAIADASATLESICRHGPDGTPGTLYRSARTETLRGPTMRASMDADHTLLLKPYSFPVTAVASATLQIGATSPISLNLQYVQFPHDARTIEIPYANIVGTSQGGGALYLGQPLPRQFDFYVALTYTGGPIPTASMRDVPMDLRRACMYLVADVLAYRINPTGAAEVRRGNTSYTFRLRGDTSGKSIYQLQAERLLQRYLQR